MAALRTDLRLRGILVVGVEGEDGSFSSLRTTLCIRFRTPRGGGKDFVPSPRTLAELSLRLRPDDEGCSPSTVQDSGSLDSSLLEETIQSNLLSYRLSVCRFKRLGILE